MSKNFKKSDLENFDFNVKDKVMREIKEKKIKMKSPAVFLAEKIGLESAIVAVLLAGALIISLIFYFLKKIGLLKFLSFGFPGVKVVLLTLPYDYVALFILSIILAIYLANKLELFCGKCERTNVFALFFLGLALVLGIFFGFYGVGDFFRGWSQKDIPAETAVHGKIINLTAGQMMVEDENGNVTTVIINENNPLISEDYFKEGKFMQAVGKRDEDDRAFFRAQKIHCFEDD